MEAQVLQLIVGKSYTELSMSWKWRPETKE